MSASDEARKAFWQSFGAEINRAVAEEQAKTDALRMQYGLNETSSAMQPTTIVMPPYTIL